MKISEASRDLRTQKRYIPVADFNSLRELIVTTLGVTLFALLCTSGSLNDISLLRSIFITDLPQVNAAISITHFVILVGIASLSVQYRSIRSHRSLVVESMYFLALIVFPLVIYGITISLFQHIFSPSRPQLASFLWSFSGPSSEMMALPWLGISAYFMKFTIGRRMSVSQSERESRGDSECEDSDSSVNVTISSNSSLRRLKGRAHFLVCIVVLLLPIEVLLLLAYSPTTFTDIGAGLILGTHTFWALVFVHNTILTVRGTPWYNGRRVSTYLVGYSIVVTQVLFFFCNDANRWLNYTVAILIILAVCSMLTYRNTRTLS